MAADTWLLMKLYWTLDRREVTGQSPLRILAFILGLIGTLIIGAAAAAVGYFSSFMTRPDFPFQELFAYKYSNQKVDLFFLWDRYFPRNKRSIII